MANSCMNYGKSAYSRIPLAKTHVKKEQVKRTDGKGIKTYVVPTGMTKNETVNALAKAFGI